MIAKLKSYYQYWLIYYKKHILLYITCELYERCLGSFLANIFFRDLVEIKQYRDKLKQYIESVERRKTNKMKNVTAEEKLIYRFYVKLEYHQLQALWDTGAQISICTKPLAVKLGLKWKKPKDDLQIVTINE